MGLAMIRLTTLVAVMSTALAGAGIASAAPDDQYCSFTLSAPQRDRNGSADVVSATLQVQHCNGQANPRRLTVCVSSGDGPGDCSVGYSWSVAKVVVPWVSGRAYAATGNGCADNGIPFHVTTCTPSGPVKATL
jgi:hypothetical protein